MAANAPESSSGANIDLQGQIRVQFTTRDTDLALPQSTGPILVPTNLRRYALSQIVNHLLATSKPIPLDFLASGSFLRSSLDDYLLATRQSSETTLTLEYVRAFVPPLFLASFQHDDWVSAVDVLSAESGVGQGAESIRGQERILSGSYDGLLRVWNLSSEILATSPNVSSGTRAVAIKSAKFISPTMIVSGGLDRSVRVWKYSEISPHEGTLVPQLELLGHRGSVESVAVHNGSSRILSGSTDHTVCLWSTKKSALPAAPEGLQMRTTKRQKVTPSNISQRGALATFTGHNGPVSSVIFDSNDTSVGHSASWDHTITTWDLVTSRQVSSRALANPLLSLLAIPDLGLLATGTTARSIALVDPRVDARTTSVMSFKGHTNAVVALAKDPVSQWRFASSSHDGTCRVWDVRAARSTADPLSASVKEGGGADSVYSLRREKLKGAEKDQSKVFDVAWDSTVGIVSGGEDKRVQTHRPGSIAPDAAPDVAM